MHSPSLSPQPPRSFPFAILPTLTTSNWDLFAFWWFTAQRAAAHCEALKSPFDKSASIKHIAYIPTIYTHDPPLWRVSRSSYDSLLWERERERELCLSTTWEELVAVFANLPNLSSCNKHLSFQFKNIYKYYTTSQNKFINKRSNNVGIWISKYLIALFLVFPDWVIVIIRPQIDFTITSQYFVLYFPVFPTFHLVLTHFHLTKWLIITTNSQLWTNCDDKLNGEFN